MIRDVWKKFNVSTILIAPLFDEITNNVFAKYNQKLKIPFIQLCIEYGLKNTYLYKNKKHDGCLYFVFDKRDFISDRQLSTSCYKSMCELLTDCKYFQNLEITSEEVIIGLTIPEKFLIDIIVIQEGAYSKVSEEYKKKLRITQTHIPKTPNDLARYVARSNLGYCIVSKHPSVKASLEKLLKTTLKDGEYYEKFSEKKENLAQ